jgi:hypothetical protein
VAPNAHGRVKIESVGPVEIMKVKVWGLPPNTGFDFFVIQVPNAPFGLSWYQGDIETNKDGVGYGEFIGRFNIETFIVAPGVAAIFNKARKRDYGEIAEPLTCLIKGGKGRRVSPEKYANQLERLRSRFQEIRENDFFQSSRGEEPTHSWICSLRSHLSGRSHRSGTAG